MLKLRLITALVLVLVFVSAVVFLDGPGFIIFVGLIATLASWEWSRLARIETMPVRLLYIGVMILIGAFVVVYGENTLLNPLLYIGSLFWIVVMIIMPRDPVETGSRLKPLTYTLLSSSVGLLLLLSLWSAFVRLHGMPGGEYHLLGMCMLVWLADTGAFITGRALGRHKLAPHVSPGKTIEGVIGGVVAAMLAALVWPYIYPLPGISQPAFLLVAALTVTASVYGDLLESVFKRIRGVKDSGRLLPGHGGILDRIDSLTAAAPVFVAGLLLLGDH